MQVTIEVTGDLLALIDERRRIYDQVAHRDFSFDQKRYDAIQADLACWLAASIEVVLESSNYAR